MGVFSKFYYLVIEFNDEFLSMNLLMDILLVNYNLSNYFRRRSSLDYFKFKNAEFF